MPKISIITPIYNNQKYLKECISSIINQTFEDFELILIDDGSTDSSPQICDEYAAEDSRIKVVHKENAGMGVSYNLGMDMAQGEYVGFIESDDFADIHMYEKLYSLAEKFDKPDIVKSSWYNYITFNNEKIKDGQLSKFPLEGQLINIKDYSWILTWQSSVWSAIYKTELLRNKNVRYLETAGASYQDLGFSFKAFCSAKNAVITSEGYYYYRQDNENSSINSKEKSDVIFTEYKEVDRFFEENPQIKTWANEDKLIKQFYNYWWNYQRIAIYLKHNFIKRFAQEFKTYRDKGELTENFYSKINRPVLDEIIDLVS